MNTKRLSMLTAAVLLVAGVWQQAWAQKMRIYFTDGAPVGYDIQKIDRVEFEESEPVVTPEWVDLGLPSGTLWATMNVGATSPEECGSYFAWGETETKDEYNWATYRYSSGSATSLTKYCLHSNYGTPDGLSVMEDVDDAAAYILGEGWSVPTKEQVAELIDQTYTEWNTDELNGVQGVRITSRTTDASIFLPIAGYMDNNYNTNNTTWGYIWTRNIHPSIDYIATAFRYGTELEAENAKSRILGINIRPVYKEPLHKYVEIGGVKWATMNIGATTVAGDYRTCCGAYCAWGETKPRYSSIEWTSWREASFTWRDDFASGYKDSPDYTGENLDAVHDAATANWGDEWRTPTKEEFEALSMACSGSSDFSQEPVKLKNTITSGGIYWLDESQTIEPDYTGVAGILLVSKDDISKRIFFPAADAVVVKNLTDVGTYGFYWSSSNYTSKTYTAYRLFFEQDGYYCKSPMNTVHGYPVRPVKK